jgi:putative FmdB family regulatory protein
MPVYDYICPDCEAEKLNEIAKPDEEISCDECGAVMERQHPAPHMLTNIIPTYPGSQKHKAGYVHKHVNRPATKTQVGYGGSVSADHPTGGGKPQD